ncbi:hypothetical protein CW731_04995 [Polaribacter sp. ALD11]|uniref:DUF6913 domain-containing protein n=1 Tax=Polaribacter sp. ALD11 TaxID=2058137 RepID=UPI000C303EC9|nr:hypothetical protein [Polaribacter sp. ALD11]AUC84686.1 hypothetical protein CW731_04995 [Polaribacter sp. ALD11]
MIFQGFKETILKKKLDKLLSNSEFGGASALKKIQTVGIITSEEITSKIDLKVAVEAALGIKNAKIYSLRAFSKTDEISYKHFTEKDINWRGQFTQTNFKSFLEQPLDLLIGYFNTNNIFLESAVLQSKAQFKVGFAATNSKLYQIEISEEIEHVGEFTSELKKYLQIIKKL